MHIGAGSGDNSVRIRPLAINQLAVLLKPDRHAGLSIGALGNGAYGKEPKHCVVGKNLAYRIEGGIHRSVAAGSGRAYLPVNLQLQRGFGRRFRACIDFKADEADAVVTAHDFIVRSEENIVVVDDLLAIGEFLESPESVVQLVITDFAIAKRSQLVAE